MPARVKEGLVVDGRAAVILAGVIRIVLPRIARRPAGAELLPELAVLLPALGADRDPCALPVAHADAVRHLAHGLDYLSDGVCLTLDGIGVILCRVSPVAHGVPAEIGILPGVSVARLHYKYLLTVGLADVREDFLKIIVRSVPEGVVGRGENVVIDPVPVEISGVAHICHTVLGICKVNGDEGARA